MSKSQDQRRTLEIKMRNANENIDHLRTRHRALRRRINLLDRKIEARERKYVRTIFHTTKFIFKLYQSPAVALIFSFYCYRMLLLFCEHQVAIYFCRFSYEYLESRVRTLKADQDAMQEKLRISDEYAASLQTKMQQFYNNRAAWNRR